jgi:hypothetical protein
MSTNYHTPWEDGTDEYKAADMNVPLGELDAAIGARAGPKKYDYMGQYLGDVLNSNALLMQGLTGRYMVLVAGAPGSRLYVGTPPTDGPATFTIKRNGTTIGTVLTNPGSNWGAFTVSADVAFINGDMLELYGPNPADASLQDVSWNIILARNDIEFMTTSTTTTATTTTTTTTTV